MAKSSCDGGPRGYVLGQQPVEEAGTALFASQGTSGAQHGARFLGTPESTLQQGLQNAGQPVEIVHRSRPPKRLVAALTLAMAPVSIITPARRITQRKHCRDYSIREQPALRALQSTFD